MTLDQLRNTLMELLDIPAEDFDPDADLSDYGLNSLQVFELMSTWQQQGLKFEVEDLVKNPSLNGWWAAFNLRA